MKLKPLLELGRVSNILTCLSNATAGFYLGGSTITAKPGTWLAAVVASMCFYEAGMALNDYCDREIDRAERPTRPIPSGAISPRQALAIVLGLFTVGLIITALAFPAALPLAIVLILLIVAYDNLHTSFALAPLLMGACRGSLYVLAAVAAGWTFSGTPAVWIIAAALTAYIASVTFIARDELVHEGTAVRTAGCVTAILSVTAILAAPLSVSPLTFVPFLVALAWVAWAVYRLLARKSPPMKAVGQMLAGISLFDAAVLGRVPSLPGVLIAWTCFLATRYLHRLIRGT